MLESQAQIDVLLAGMRRIAVLGIKTRRQGGQPAYYVPADLQQAGLEVIPVPVYFPDVTEILGQPVQRRLREVTPPVDLVNVFRRPQDLSAHLDDLLLLAPGAVWLQLGIRNEEFSARCCAAGIDVVQDRCLMVEYRRWRAARGGDGARDVSGSASPG